jgi:hypothetical protein
VNTQVSQVCREWKSGEDFDRATRRQVSVGPDGLRLRRGVTVTDEIGRCTRRDQEFVAGLRQAKKVFALEAVHADTALLCPYLRCDRPGGELEVLVNGRAVRVSLPEKREYWEDAWTRVEIPADSLEAGENEVVFRAVGEARWSLMVENSVQPNRSLVSEDGGQTWRSDDLGDNNRADGEYVVRLWLDQFEQRGEVVSEPIDLLGLASEGDIAPRGRVRSVKLTAEQEVVSGAAVRLEWRAGPTPSYEPESWQAWRETEDGAVGEVEEGFRYGQWRLLLHTGDPAVSPLVKAVSLCAQVDVSTEASARVTDADNSDLVRSSYRFAHLASSEPRAAQLRERWKLDQVVGPAKTEFEAFLLLRQWVRNQWEDGWNMGPLDFCPPWDGMVILELAHQQLGLGMCTHYATVMTQCCAALGFTARTQIMRCHCIVEVWSNDYGKWVSMDIGGDSDDATKFTYHFERNGIPLSALEAHRAWVDGAYGDLVVSPQPPEASGDRFTVKNRLNLWERFMISLRNDELTTLEPGEPEHGAGSYHYDGYLFWEDEKTKALPWFSRHTDREADLYWSLNRARIHLGQGAEPEVLEVELETDTPNLKGFQIQLDGEGWEGRDRRFEWRLHKGENLLTVRPVNDMDRAGMVSSVTVTL